MQNNKEVFAVFWDKYVSSCKELKKSPSGLAKELGITASTVSSWKKGCVPNGDTLVKISEITQKSIEYFVSDTEESISLSSKKSAFKSIHAIPQRFVSIISGEVILKNDLYKISRYVNCDETFLTDPYQKIYSPFTKQEELFLFDVDTLHLIFMILDRCADSELYKNVQIQLSRIILYWALNEKTGWTVDKIKAFKEVDSAKIDFILFDKPNLDSTRNYGFNFTEFTVISRRTNLSYQYLLTGIDDSIMDIYERQKNELEKLKAELNNK